MVRLDIHVAAKLADPLPHSSDSHAGAFGLNSASLSGDIPFPSS